MPKLKCDFCGGEFDPENLTSVFMHWHEQPASQEIAAHAIGIKGKRIDEPETKPKNQDVKTL